MTARMKNPAMVLPDAMTGIQNIYKAMHKGGVPETTLELVHLRASQINGCSPCVDAGVKSARKAGETDERAVAGGRMARVESVHRLGAGRAGDGRGGDPAGGST